MTPSVEAIAECYCNAEEPFDVIVKNWQTFRPKVTAMHSLNAHLANNLGQQVYYVPTLEELPDVKSRMYDCVDYAGSNKRFAAIYDGYFNNECYDALVRKSDGTYSSTPAIVSSEGYDCVKELTTLGYDFLLTSESMRNPVVHRDSVAAEYSVNKLNLQNGTVDLGTALMDIYKAVGQEKHDITYVFAEDLAMNVSTSPIQKEIHLSLAQDNSIDTSDGKGYVFATRTSPSLYWKQAAYDGIIWDSEALGVSVPAGRNIVTASKSDEVTLAEFCTYAYTIMDIYGEPVMTQAEKSILLQVYGTVVPYESCSEYEVEAIETFIAKGIISPEDDVSYMNWNAPINPKYFLTLLMRIKDTGARMTYKDVQITMEASMIDNHYYNANLTVETSNIVDVTEEKSFVRVSSYKDFYISEAYLTEMMDSMGTSTAVANELFLPTHLMVQTANGDLFPIMTQVTTLTGQVYSETGGMSGVIGASQYDSARDGQLVQFAVSNGIITREGERVLHLRVVAFEVPTLMRDGGYRIVLVDDKGNVSDSYVTIGSEGNISSQGVYEEEEEDWEDDEDAEYFMNTSESVPCLITIMPGTEGMVVILDKDNNASSRTLSEIMTDSAVDGIGYYDTNNMTGDLSFRKINDTMYEVNGAASVKDLRERLRENNNGARALTAYSKKNEELMVSGDWLLQSGFLSVEPRVSGEVMTLVTKYSNIFLDRERGHIMVGSVVYNVRNYINTREEIWFQQESGDYFINFRAVLGWTGDFLIFKSASDGSISVSIKELPTDQNNPMVGNSASKYAVKIRMFDYQSNALDRSASQGVSLDIQGNHATETNKSMIPMTSMYPFCNYFIYFNPDVFSQERNAIDWLFVFKPRTVMINGNKVTFDDTAAREHLYQQVGDIDLDENISVWAYPLYKTGNPGSQHPNQPEELKYSDEYGYVYEVQVDNVDDAIANYFNPDTALGGSTYKSSGDTNHPLAVLPFYLDNGKIRCFNFNTYTYEDANGNEVMMEYGEMPANVVIPRITNIVQLGVQYAYSILTGTPVVKQEPAKTFNTVTTKPTVVSPALWFLELNRYDFDEVFAYGKETVELYWGTNKVTVDDTDGSYKLYLGQLEVTDKLKDSQFLLLREIPGGRRWYSVTALNSFKMDSIYENGEGTANIMESPQSGVGTVLVDVIDWDEFTLERILEDFEFAVAILMIITLFIIPRIALFTFLVLIALGVIQNLKLTQWFCDKVFDPYRFLTMGRRDVHTFKSGVAFRNSLIAMAIFALFMDGTVIHVYEWILKFVTMAFRG